MAKESEIKVRVEPDVKAEMERYAAELGLNLSSYLRYLHAKHKRQATFPTTEEPQNRGHT